MPLEFKSNIAFFAVNFKKYEYVITVDDFNIRVFVRGEGVEIPKKSKE